jgi:hypothetical protein
MDLDRSLAGWAVMAVFAFGAVALAGCAGDANSGDEIEVGTSTNTDEPAPRPTGASDLQVPSPKSGVPALAKSPKIWDEVQIGARVALPEATH